MRILALLAIALCVAGCNSVSQEQTDAATAAMKARVNRDAENIKNMLVAQARYSCIYELHFRDGSPEYETCFRDTLRMKAATYLQARETQIRQEAMQVYSDFARRQQQPREVTCQNDMFGGTRCRW